MHRAVVALLALPLAFCAARAGEEPKRVEISWHGQSFFVIKSGKGTNLATDPHLIPEYGRALSLKADAVLMSHAHNDHTQLEAIPNKDKKAIKVIKGFKGVGQRADWNEVNEEFKEFKVRGVPTYHDDVQGMKYGKNTAFVIEVDGWKICHLGDLGHLLSPAQVKAIGPVDVLMIPVGGIYTLNGSEARKVVEQIKPKEYIIPMHYGTAVFPDLLSVDEFLEDVPQERVAKARDNRLVLNRDAQRPRPLVAVLHWWPRATKEEEKEK
jgi:L-ascorbate metabolism protein UlaG (beta-lactamase superfamily)